MTDTTEYIDHIHFCPSCGEKYAKKGASSQRPFDCDSCGFGNHIKSFPTVSAIIPQKGSPHKVLIAKRAKEPHKGKYVTTGGFLDYGESWEIGIIREIREELGVDVEAVEVLTARNETYSRDGLIYPVVVTIFLTTPVEAKNLKVDKRENEEAIFVDIDEVLLGKYELAWQGEHKALEVYKQRHLIGLNSKKVKKLSFS